MLAGYLNEEKRYVTIAVGCTGGKHRSVAVSEAIAARLRERGSPRRRVGPRPRQGMRAASPAVVALGGGHGLSASLSALRLMTDRITAVVTVADDGGSSGRLRDELGVLPPGDLRMALSALCDDSDWGRTWRDLLQHRFSSSGDLDQHAVGNLLIVALWELLGDTVEGLDWVGKLLGARGRVLPMAAVPLRHRGGRRSTRRGRPALVVGQSAVAVTTGTISQVRLRAGRPAGLPGGGGGDRGRRLDRARAGLLVHVGAPAPARPRVAGGARTERARARS